MDYSYSTTNDGARDAEDAFRDIDVLSGTLVGLLILGMIILVAYEIAAFEQVSLLGRAFTREEALINDRRMSLVAAGILLQFLLTVVIFAIWIVRAHRNLPALGARRLDITPGWALGYFFIPFLNFWKPFAAMRTLWKASHNGPGWEYEDVPWWVALWWVGWMVTSVVDRLFSRLGNASSALDRLALVTRASMYVEACALIVDGLAALLVYRIWKAQKAQLAAREAAKTVPAPPSLRDALPRRA